VLRYALIFYLRIEFVLRYTLRLGRRIELVLRYTLRLGRRIELVLRYIFEIGSQNRAFPALIASARRKMDLGVVTRMFNISDLESVG